MTGNRISRRTFVAGTASLGLGASSMAQAGLFDPSLVRAVGQPMPGRVTLPETPPPAPGKDSVGIAIIGLGGYALRQIMPNILRSKRTHVAALVSGNVEKMATVGAAYGVPEDAQYTYDRFADISADDRVDATYVILPSGLHAEWTEKSFAAGKHVLCEKPMALNSAECQRMIAASEAAGLKLMIGYRCHFEPFNLAAMALMRDGAVGSIERITTAQKYRAGDRTGNWRHIRALAGGGPLEDYGIYGVQSALYLSGEMPTEISAETVQPKDDPRFTEIFSDVKSRFTFPSGAYANLETSYNASGANEALVFGDAGTLTMRPATGYGGHRMTLEQSSGPQALTPGDPTVQFAGQMDHFADAIRDNTPIITPGEMGLRDVRIIEAIYASAAAGAPVTVLPDGRLG